MEMTAETTVQVLDGTGNPLTPAMPLSDFESLARKGRKPMKETEADRKVSSDAYGIAAEELRQFVERYEHLEAEKKDIAEQMKEVMAEAKGRGYDTKALRKIIAIRKRDKDDLAEEEAVIEMYKAALGMT
jgi:uncharacterized protein (UPF0335 family)